MYNIDMNINSQEQSVSPESQEARTGHDLHVLAEISRDNKQYSQAIQYAQRAEVKYRFESLGKSPLERARLHRDVAETYASRALTYRLWTGEDPSKDKALDMAVSAVTTAQAIKEDPTAVAVPLLTLGKVHEDRGNLGRAREDYINALNALTKGTQVPNQHNNPGTRADIAMHIHIVDYKVAKLEDRLGVLEQAEATFKQLDTTQNIGVAAYEQVVWATGGYMHLAEAVLHNSPTPEERVKVKEYLNRAQELLDMYSPTTDDPRSPDIRREQLIKIKEEFGRK